MINESDINFRKLAYEINDGIFVSDPNGKFIYANLAMAEIFGLLQTESLIGSNFEEFLPPGSSSEFMNQFRKTVVPGKNPEVIKTEIIKKNKKTALVEVRPVPFIKESKLLGIQGVVHDITERKQAEKEMMFDLTHDSLTGIYNRSFFEAEIGRLERGRQFPISIIVVKVGFLNELSESEDDGIKDKLIRRVGYRVFHTLRGDDIVARIQENEFAVLLPSVNEHILDEIIQRIREDLSEINAERKEPALEFFIGAGTAKGGIVLNSVLRRAEAIAQLAMKKKIPD